MYTYMIYFLYRFTDNISQHIYYRVSLHIVPCSSATWERLTHFVSNGSMVNV